MLTIKKTYIYIYLIIVKKIKTNKNGLKKMSSRVCVALSCSLFNLYI